MTATFAAPGAARTESLAGDRVVRPAPVREWWSKPWVIVLAAVVVRLLALLFIEGDVNDGTTRIGTAAAWFFDGVPTFGRTVWGEGNYVLPGLALLVWRDPFWSVRILYALIAATNAWLALKVTSEAFDLRAGAVTGWIVALMPFHLFMSSNGATSEAPYITCILAAVWAVMRYRQTPRASLAAIAGLALALATTVRFDGVIWGLPLAASFVLLLPGERARFHIERRTVGHLAIFGVCGLLYVLVIFWRWSMLYPTPWYPLDQAKLNTLQFFAGGQHQRWPNWLYQTYVVLFWPAATLAILTPGLGIVSWVGFVAALRRVERAAVPLALGLVVASAWLAYAAFTHAILAQFRYALIIAVTLAAYTVPGVRAIRARLPRLRLTHVVVATAAVGLAWQAVVSDASLHARGVLTNQFRSISPVQRSQFAARDLLTWADRNATRETPLVVTPYIQSSYYLLKGRPLIDAGRVIVQSYYLPNSQFVHTRASLADVLAQEIAGARWVATSTGTRQLGLRDGMASELVAPTRLGSTYQWHGIQLAPVANWGDIQLWRVERATHERTTGTRE